ncbi:membrane protein [Lapidilactobacillus concavus DSM 17758]|uniref:Membrane protein n=1 Tax=Lapidilactobacillus concavus DSM 17758 TaxID=1423735 RepID=A0A0R1VPS3_9LACO|nr:EpsG family protein [Lapidilactobacillus concavus]KRM07770.1 membrane protein [Lapidilactobacillus concavus DSM 17758]GEL13709.1 hypothetical protein LCO01nite_12580 [Lapidilactobacillus concavus]
MWIYSLVFLFATTLLLFSTLIPKKQYRNLIAIVPIGILSIITGTRYYMGGYDIYNYDNTFNITPVLNDFHLLDTIKSSGLFGSEIGYKFLNSLIKTLGFNFFGFTLIVSVFFYVCVYAGLSNFTNNMNLIVVVMMYKAFLGLTFVYMRQCIAVGIFLLSIKYLREGKFLKYCILILIASTIHFATIFLIPLYLLRYVKLTKKRIIIYSIVFTLTIFISMLNINVLSHLGVLSSLFSGSAQDKIDSVAGSGNAYQGGTNLLHLAEFLVLDIFLILGFDRIKLDKNKEIMIKLFLCILPFYSLFVNEGILVRMPFYLLLSYGMVIEYLVENKSVGIKLIIYSAVSVICFLGMYKYVSQFDGGIMMTYRSFLQYGLSIFR